MPTGVGAETLNFLPDEPFVMDPALFFSLTERNMGVQFTEPEPGPGNFINKKLQEVGIVAKLIVVFDGTLTVAVGGATSGHDWPYGLLKRFILSANGQNDIWNCDGVDLHALRFVRYPSFDELVDDHAGTVGGGDALPAATTNLHLTWEVPIAIDDVSLVGSLFAQSPSTNLQIKLQQALNADLFSVTPANVTIDGTFSVQDVHFEVPYDDKRQLVLPDITRIHGFNVHEVPFSNTGVVRAPLIRGAGQLVRLFLSAERNVNNRLSALPSAADADTITDFRLEYGGNQRPFDVPGANLLAINNQHYGGPVPYNRAVFDFIKENPTRDALLLQGVTELVAVPVVHGSVFVTAGLVRLAQETLF